MLKGPEWLLEPRAGKVMGGTDEGEGDCYAAEAMEQHRDLVLAQVNFVVWEAEGQLPTLPLCCGVR